MSDHEQGGEPEPPRPDRAVSGLAEARRRFGGPEGDAIPADLQTRREQGRAEARRRFGPPPGDAA